MCGIVGQYNPRGGDLDLVTRMVTRLVHRGPDGCGTYRHGPPQRPAARLAIIDLAAGAMPIFNEDRSVAVVYNGEIYNYRDLRAELERAGHVFATHTDTEVLVHGYEAWGDDVVNRLRGMFALCIWDQARERILLARDRLAEKPLYYAQVGEAVLFASEIKALLEDRALPRRVDADALLHFLVRARLAAALEPVLAVPRAACFTDRLAYGGLRLWLAEDSNMRVDKMTMAMSVEARAPFEDHPLAEMALRIALEHKLHGGGSKVVLKEALRGLVPEPVLTRPKWGFIPPMSNWLRTVFRPLVETVLAPERVAAAGWCDPAAVTRLVDDHMARRSYELWTVWPLLVFHLWHALMIDGSLVLDHTLAPEDFGHLVVA